MKPKGPIVAVVPFQTAGEDGHDRLVAQGLLEDICGELTRFPTLQVISWMSGLAVADLPDPEVGRRLGATHVLRGSLRRMGTRLRVSAALVDARDATQVWREQFDAPVDGLFEIQDEIVGRISATLVARLEERILTEARRKPTEMLAAYEVTLRALMLLRQGSREADEQARTLFHQALELDPNYARAHGGLSLSYFNQWSCQFWATYDDNGRKAYAHAHRALDLDDSDPMLHLVIGRILLYQRQFDQASWYFDRALALCPNDAGTLIELAICEVFLGRPDIAVAHAEEAMRLNPYHPNHYYAYAAFAYFAAHEFETALAVGANAVDVPIVDMPAYSAVALAYLGRLDEARRHLTEFEAGFREKITYGREPLPGESFNWILTINPYRRKVDEDFLREGFRLLGAQTDLVPQNDAPVAVDTRPERLVQKGDGWMVQFRGHQIVVGDMKGLHDIRRLLERPGDELHCLDLAERMEESYAGDETLDSTARQALKLRIRDLQEELAEAEDMNDLGRALRLNSEMEELLGVLSAALGLRGRTRRLGSLAERARTTVTWRIRHAVRKLGEAHAPLGKHLENSVRTGTFCSYKPEHPVEWRFAAE